jgi:hypothetical protein
MREPGALREGEMSQRPWEPEMHRIPLPPSQPNVRRITELVIGVAIGVLAFLLVMALAFVI